MPMLAPILRIRLKEPGPLVRNAGASVPNVTVLSGTKTQPMPKPCVRPVRIRVPCDTSDVKPVIGLVTPAAACWMEVGAVAESTRKISYAGYRFPPKVIHQAIWFYLPVHTELS